MHLPDERQTRGCVAIIGLLGTLVSGSSSPAPLMLIQIQTAMRGCMPTPNPPLFLQTAWAGEGQGADPVTWAQRQPLRGAVIPAEHVRRTHQSNLYVIVAVVTDVTRGGGWALGEVVRYRAAGRTYTFKAEGGIGIGS